MNRKILSGMIAGGAMWFAACNGVEPEPEELEEPVTMEEEGVVEEDAGSMTGSGFDVDEDKIRAVADLMAKSGSNLSGEAFFVPVSEGSDEITFGVYVENVSPGQHAVHIHEIGDCSAEDASSAGDHWNPTNAEHGRWGEEPFHLGDIGNIEVAEDGTGSLSMSTDLWSIEEGADYSVLGKAIVVHEGADDFTTQPDGGGGGRIGCGVIELKDPT